MSASGRCRPAAQQPGGDELVQHPDDRLGRLATGQRSGREEVQVLRPHRQLRSRAAQLRRQDVRILRVEHRRFDRPAEDRLGVVGEVGVQWVVTGDEHDQRLLARAAGPTGLLPQRRDRPRKAGQHHRVQSGDVESEFQRVRRRHAQQFAGRERRLQGPSLLG
jgi:hypothetical protein